MPRTLNAKEVEYLLSIKREDVNTDLLKDLFTTQDFKTPPRFATNDRFHLPPNKYFNKDVGIDTTIGRYLVNMFVFPKKFLYLHGYINEPLTKKYYNKLEGEMGEYLMNDELTVDDYKEYIDNAAWLFLGQSYMLNPSMNAEVIVPIDEVIAERDKMFEDNAEKLAEGDPSTVDKLESTLTKKAKELMKQKGTPSMDYYDAGISSFENVYKKTAIMVGALTNPATGKTEVVKSNFSDGLKKQDYGAASHLSVIGGYARAEGTKASGYSNKKILNTTFGLVLDDPGTDCGTEMLASIKITKDNKSVLLDRYIVENGKYVCLDYKTIGKYVGKTVQMRTPMYCHGGKICNICAGEQYYKLDTKNVGMHASAIGGRLLNLGMKKFHDASISYYTLDVDDFIE